ncbi:AraC family transcriptional regulator [Sporolactobacillus sp. Y61]|uniref:AraC family transcriptional regulator n=1 Tax=Sporolactobacillus sp. Y61 TaxID=3160863 RepID=A0AAU8IIW7_9BACL
MKKVMELKTHSRELSLVSCGYEECTKTQSFGPLSRNYYMLHFVLNGSGYYWIDGKSYMLQKNWCFFTPHELTTFYRANSQTPWTYVWICFDGNSVSSILKHCHLSAEHAICCVPHIEEVKHLIFEMMNDSLLTPANELYIQGNLYHIFALLEKDTGASFSDMEIADNVYISQALNYIISSSRHSYERLTVKHVANHLHVSRSYLYSLFKRYLNMSPQQFIKQSKITRAGELLAKTDAPITEIAGESGYKNPFAFSRAFKSEHFLTPQEYRKIYKHPQNLLNI